VAYNEHLANRTREFLSSKRNVKEKKMMGGLTFMVNDKMCVGILKNDLMARIDPADYEKALERKGCREMDFTGKPMKGFVFVGPEGTKSKKDLDHWISLALDFNKKAKSSKKKSRTKYALELPPSLNAL
jgi:TfoX/Sxy family transcriptional regulator of competence genes